ncbi:YggT family protein [Neisseria sp. S1]|uniref:YggT family protein n=1 Tax=Neisseria sp. S1 TaxID=3318354 RepID=UPI003A8677D9
MWINKLLVLADVAAIICLARCLLQWAKLPFAHPLAQFCCKTTDWLVRPLRGAAPPLGKWDGACILAALLLYYLAFTVITFSVQPQGFGMRLLAANLFFAVLHLVKAAVYVLLLGLLLRMLLGFKQPFSPLLPVLHRIFEPLLRPFVFLRIGRWDFSGSLLALVLWFWLVEVLPGLTTRLNLWLLHQ